MSKETGLRERLIVAALDMLESRGEEPSLRAVARAAGVSAMAPYRHFADKPALLAAVADHGFEALRISMTIAVDLLGPGEALLAQGMAYVTFARTNPALFRLMFSHQHFDTRAAADQGTYEILARHVTEMLPAHAMPATLACWSMMHGMASLMLSDKLPKTEHVAIATAMRLFVAGLRPGVE